MPKFKVLSGIEHNEKLYVPPGTTAAQWSPVLDADGKQTGWTAPSAAHGRPVPVDDSGAIELTKLEAGPLRAAGVVTEVPESEISSPESPKKKK
jgi:hypothetical protein